MQPPAPLAQCGGSSRGASPGEGAVLCWRTCLHGNCMRPGESCIRHGGQSPWRLRPAKNTAPSPRLQPLRLPPCGSALHWARTAGAATACWGAGWHRTGLPQRQPSTSPGHSKWQGVESPPDPPSPSPTCGLHALGSRRGQTRGRGRKANFLRSPLCEACSSSLPVMSAASPQQGPAAASTLPQPCAIIAPRSQPPAQLQGPAQAEHAGRWGTASGPRDRIMGW